MNPTEPDLKMEALKREMARKANDRIKVFNDTNEDYVVTWDKYPHRVPANGEAILPRYIAKKYVTEMTDKKLNYISDENVRMENARRIKKGMAVMNKHEEQPVFEAKFAINQPQLRKPIIASLWGGVVEEFGIDQLPKEEGVRPQDTRPLDDQLLDEIETIKAPVVITEEPLSETQEKQDQVLQDITA